ncbi:MAG TPA: ADOP family duplicated permease [Opitutaceae bacterium]|nr:ADOP family duplicated permease [Opitutaceae bacterium]
MNARRPGAWIFIEGWSREFRHAARRLIRAPAFSLTVLGSLIICFGPNVATLSALYALVLKPLPFPDPGQLVTIVNVAEKSGGQQVLSSTTQYLDFKAHADLFSGFATSTQVGAVLTEETAPRVVSLNVVSANFFDVLGVPPLLGRYFSPGEEVAGRNAVVVISESFWRSHYGADPNIVGTTVRIWPTPCTIIGVAPRSLEALYRQTCFFQPYVAAASKYDPQTRYRGDLALFGRLKPGVSLQAGLAQLTALEQDFRRERAGPALRALIASAGYQLVLQPLRPGMAIGNTDALWLLEGGALLVLLIGCVNVVNLFLARLNGRRGELAVRVALGAGRGALLRSVAAESILLLGVALGCGLAIAGGILRVFNHYLPILISGAPPVGIDAAVAAAVVAGALLVAFLVVGIPLQVLWRHGLRLSQSRGGSTGAATRAVSGALVIGQVAVAVILLVGASLLLRSFARVMASDLGFDATHVVESRVTLSPAYRTPASRLEIQRRIIEAARSIPGVEHVAVSLRSVVVGNERPVPFATRGGEYGEVNPLVHIVAVSPEFFATVGVRVVSGRAFNEADDFRQGQVAVVDESFRDHYFPGQMVEGREIYLNWGFPLGVDGWPRIVGVVNRANLTGRDSRDNLPIVYVPTVGFPMYNFDVLVRSPRTAPDLMAALRGRLHDLDPTLVLGGGNTLDLALDNLLTARRGVTLLLGVFAGLALLLAAVGLYGVLSYDVSQRTRELGIRAAIGATRWQIVGLVVRGGMVRTGLGVLAGMAGAALLTRYLQALLFGIVATDAVSYVAVVTLIAAVSLLACWLPARRAAKVDPVVALRAE